MKGKVLSILLSMALTLTSVDITVFTTEQTTVAEIMSDEGTNLASKGDIEEKSSEANTRTGEMETEKSIVCEENSESIDSIENNTETEEDSGKTVVSEENSESTETIVENSDIEENFSAENSESDNTK